MDAGRLPESGRQGHEEGCQIVSAEVRLHDASRPMEYAKATPGVGADRSTWFIATAM